MICYSWISGIQDVAVVVFVRKAAPVIQYLTTTITDEKRPEYFRLAEATISQVETGEFLSHRGIRFPQNGCTSCSHLGLCLGSQNIVESNLIRKPGARNLDWLDHLAE